MYLILETQINPSLFDTFTIETFTNLNNNIEMFKIVENVSLLYFQY